MCECVRLCFRGVCVFGVCWCVCVCVGVWSFGVCVYVFVFLVSVVFVCDCGLLNYGLCVCDL